MKNNEKEKGFINVQLFADESNGDAQSSNTTQSSIDYESEYKKMLAERDSYKQEAEKQKGLKDKYASENADYKKKELDKMTDDEKKAKEYQELIDSKNKMEAELKALKQERDLMDNGFSSEESKKLIDSNFGIKELAEIVTNRVDEAVKSAKAGLIKTTTPNSQMGNGTANGNQKTEYQKYQESHSEDDGIVEL